MKRIVIFIFLMLFSGIGLMAQQPQGMVDDPTDPVFRAKFETVDFQGSVAAEVLDDATKRYYLVDMKQFPSRFEKIWFLNLVFSDEMIVNMDSDISQDRMWFMAFKRYPAKEVLAHFESLKTQTHKVGKQMTSAEQKQWMEQHDKYIRKEDRQ